MAATLTSIKRTDGIAGQVAYDVEAELFSGTYRFGFTGTIYGNPGPVILITDSGHQVPVDDPGRFGEFFDEKWVRAFFAGWGES